MSFTKNLFKWPTVYNNKTDYKHDSYNRNYCTTEKKQET